MKYFYFCIVVCLAKSYFLGGPLQCLLSFLLLAVGIHPSRVLVVPIQKWVVASLRGMLQVAQISLLAQVGILPESLFLLNGILLKSVVGINHFSVQVSGVVITSSAVQMASASRRTFFVTVTVRVKMVQTRRTAHVLPLCFPVRGEAVF